MSQPIQFYYHPLYLSLCHQFPLMAQAYKVKYDQNLLDQLLQDRFVINLAESRKSL